MLKRITCDKFKTQPGEFRTGLNVVLGSSGGSNAIGKSTFLLILDFVFGGDNYSKSAKDVIAHIDHHTLNFEFEFDSTPYFFSRSTNRPSVVNRCDSKFHVIEELTVPKYRELLLHEYKILLQSVSFGEIVDRFFRIYGHGNHNEHKPLQGERVKRQAKLGRVFDDKPAKVSNIATGFKMPKIQMKYDDPFTQAEYVYSSIESEVDV